MFTLDEFVVVPSNQLAFATAKSIVGQNFDMFSPDVVVNVDVSLDTDLITARKRALKAIEAITAPRDITTESKLINPDKLVDMIKTPLNGSRIDKQYPGLA